MLKALVQWLTYELMAWIDRIDVPISVWEVHGQMYGAITAVLPYMTKIPFVPWQALADVVGMVLTLWLVLLALWSTLRVIMLKWGS